MSLKVAAPTLVHTHSVINEEKRKTETSRETGKSEMGRLALKFVGRDRKCQERKDTETTSERKRHKEAGGKNATGEKRVRLCENRRARSQTTSPLYIQPEQLETRDHRREREKITLPHYSNHFLENEARLSPSLSLLISFLPSLLCAAATAVFTFPLSFCEDKPLENAVITVPPSLPPQG